MLRAPTSPVDSPVYGPPQELPRLDLNDKTGQVVKLSLTQVRMIQSINEIQKLSRSDMPFLMGKQIINLTPEQLKWAELGDVAEDAFQDVDYTSCSSTNFKTELDKLTDLDVPKETIRKWLPHFNEEQRKHIRNTIWLGIMQSPLPSQQNLGPEPEIKRQDPSRDNKTPHRPHNNSSSETKAPQPPQTPQAVKEIEKEEVVKAPQSYIDKSNRCLTTTLALLALAGIAIAALITFNLVAPSFHKEPLFKVGMTDGISFIALGLFQTLVSSYFLKKSCNS